MASAVSSSKPDFKITGAVNKSRLRRDPLWLFPYNVRIVHLCALLCIMRTFATVATYVRLYYSDMPKSKLTILIDDTVIEAMKIRAVQEKRSVGEITEDLYREYVKRPKAKDVKK